MPYRILPVIEQALRDDREERMEQALQLLSGKRGMPVIDLGGLL